VCFEAPAAYPALLYGQHCRTPKTKLGFTCRQSSRYKIFVLLLSRYGTLSTFKETIICQIDSQDLFLMTMYLNLPPSLNAKSVILR
jgi:hypothetical protein